MPDDSRDRLIRLEETMKHILDSLAEIKRIIESQNKDHSTDMKDTNSRVDELEKKVQTMWAYGSAAVFIGTPLITLASKFLFKSLGL